MSSFEPERRRRAILDDAREHGLLAEREEVEAAVLADLIAPATVSGDVTSVVAGTPLSLESETATSGLSPGGPPLGESLVAAPRTEGTYVIAATTADLCLFPTSPHHHHRVDHRSGAWTREPLGTSFVAGQPLGGLPHGRPGVLEVGERRFLVERGEGEAAAAVARAAQRARGGR